jgi:hypothetical protein
MPFQSGIATGSRKGNSDKCYRLHCFLILYNARYGRNPNTSVFLNLCRVPSSEGGVVIYSHSDPERRHRRRRCFLESWSGR